MTTLFSRKSEYLCNDKGKDEKQLKDAMDTMKTFIASCPWSPAVRTIRGILRSAGKEGQ